MEKSILIQSIRKLGISCSDLPWDLDAEGRDNWVSGTILRSKNINSDSPAAVCWPETTEQVASLAHWATENDVGLIACGGYTSLTGSVSSRNDSVTVNMRRMNRIWFSDKENRLFRCQAGIYGKAIENFLKEHNLTFGHVPSSFDFSTPGGWLSTGAAGLFSSRFGKAQDLCRSITFVSGCGEIFEYTNHDLENNLMPLIMGSEGTFGFITEAEFEAHVIDSTMEVRGIYFQTLEDGLTAMKNIIQSGLKPSILRLYDPFTSLLALSSSDSETDFSNKILSLIRGAAPLGWLGHKSLPLILKGNTLIRKTMDQYFPSMARKGCLMIIGFHGNEESDLVSFAAVESILDRKKITKIEINKVRKWYENRNALAFKRNRVFNSGVFADTMEISATWNRIEEIYRNIKSILSTQAFTGVHFSHAWPEGACIYFTFARAFSDPENGIMIHRDLWNSALNEVIRLSGGISHHHGIGRLKMDFYTKDTADGKILFSAAKNFFDTAKIMNRGCLVNFPETQTININSQTDFNSWLYFRDLAGRDSCFERENFIELKPSSTLEVSKIIRSCFHDGVKLHVLRPSSPEGSVILNPEKLDKVLHINRESLLVHVQTGITIEKLEEVLRKENLTSGIVATVDRKTTLHEIFAHNLELPGFYNSFHGNRITGFNAVWWNGDTVSSKSIPSKSHGPEFFSLITGKRGKYGIVTDVHLKVFPADMSIRTARTLFNNSNDLIEFVSFIYRSIDTKPWMCLIRKKNQDFICDCFFTGNSIITGLQIQNLHSFPLAWFESDTPDFNAFQCRLFPVIKPLKKLKNCIETEYELISISSNSTFSIYNQEQPPEGTFLRSFVSQHENIY